MSQDRTEPRSQNELAKERNLLAGDRTLMAWLRTSLSLLGFGFAIAQGYEYFESGYLDETGRAVDALRTPFYFGMSFMVLGLLSTLAGIAQYFQILKELRIDDPTFTQPWPFTLAVAILLMIIGALGILAVVI